MSPTMTGILAAVGVLLLILFAAIRIVREYERGVIFRLGRVIGAKGPGLFFIIPIVDRMVKVSLRTITMDIPPQDVITKDNVTVRVNAVTYFNVVDPTRSIVAIEDHVAGTSQIAQTTLRSILGQVDLDELLVKREEINQRLQQIIDDVTNPWGVKVTLVEIKHVELPETMRRAMARQAEAERDRRAKVIHAHGEFEAAETLGRAGTVLEQHPAAMQLRVLSTMAEVSTERTSTLIFPLPIELFRLVDTLRQSAADGGDRNPPDDNRIQTASEPTGAPPSGRTAG
ncbi:slipin family protein [Nonomuraea sp. SYSU D8015]|uniref:slipin family protein n=1 Tax=Nonomuraea sp. SYSU D8015 TaxID=2593644 RepID=UPI00166146CD|nr:slipin family protein [Nonomuraea sp. SYSU D8015]